MSRRATSNRAIVPSAHAWAIVTVEDLEGAIDVLFFPKDYMLASTTLIEDTVVVVKGHLVTEKEQPEVHAREVSTPSLETGTSGPVVVNLPLTRCTPPVVEQLKDVLRTHPGTTEVRLRLMARGGTKVLKVDDGLRVTPSSALSADLKSILGPGCLS